MAGLGRKVFAASEVLTAQNVQDYLMDQSVMVYDDAADRNLNIGTAVAEGMVTYTKDDNAVSVYDGSNWNPLSQAISHNYIINGAFDVWQRGTSGFSDSSYTADRWRVFYGTGGTAAVTQQPFTSGDIEAIGFGDAKYFLRFDQTVAPSTGNSNIATRIEDVRTLAGQTVTLSFWAKAESVRNLDIQSVYVPDGSAAGTDTQTTVAIGTTWQRYSVTFTRTSTSGLTIGSNSYLEIRFRNTQQIAEYFDIWGVQLEAGSVATPFRRHAPSLQGELAACQRYYTRLTTGGNANQPFAAGFVRTTTEADFVLHFPQTMRSAPTIPTPSGAFRVFNPTSLSISGFPTLIADTNKADVRATVSIGVAGNGATLTANNDANAYIEIIAEL